MKGRTFVFGAAVPEMTRIAGAAALREAGATLLSSVDTACDYFIADLPNEGEQAKQRGAGQVITTLTTADGRHSRLVSIEVRAGQV